MLCIYSWFIWQYTSHPRWHERSVKAMSDDDLSFWTSVLSGWRVMVENYLYHCYSCLDRYALWTLYFTMYYELCNPKIDVVLPDWQSESQGAINPYEWCSHCELRASRAGNEGGNRQNKLHLESRTPSWARLWTLSSMPSIYGNDIPTGKPGTLDGRPQGSYLGSVA